MTSFELRSHIWHLVNVLNAKAYQDLKSNISESTISKRKPLKCLGITYKSPSMKSFSTKI